MNEISGASERKGGSSGSHSPVKQKVTLVKKDEWKLLDAGPVDETLAAVCAHNEPASVSYVMWPDPEAVQSISFLPFSAKIKLSPNWVPIIRKRFPFTVWSTFHPEFAGSGKNVTS